MHSPRVPMARMLAMLIVLGHCASVFGQTTIDPLRLWSVRPGTSCALKITGKNLDASLQAFCPASIAHIKVEPIDKQQAMLTIDVAEDAPLGPLNILLATGDKPPIRYVIVIEDLPATLESESNHDRQGAQELNIPCVINGHSDASKSDFFRFRAAAGQRLAFEVATQFLRSKMDPRAILYDASGQVLFDCDDSEVGPECGFEFEFKEDGIYLLELHDSKHSPGLAYHLRIGDFPILSHRFPLAIERNKETQVQFLVQDQPKPLPVSVQVTSVEDVTWVASRYPNGRSALLFPVMVQDFPQFTEPLGTSDSILSVAEGYSIPTLSAPIGINGILQKSSEQDQYIIHGEKGQKIRVISRTRSLGSPTLLRMSLVDSKNKILAETKITERDEWSFDYEFLESGDYKLLVSDLLGRGGYPYAYWVGVVPANSFSIELKPVASTKNSFVMETEHGIAAIDLTIDRAGYDGEILVSLPNDCLDLVILNPLIPAKAKEAKIYLKASDAWQKETLKEIRLFAAPTSSPGRNLRVSSKSLLRMQDPHVPFPSDRDDGNIAIKGIQNSKPYYQLESNQKLQFAKSASQHSHVFNLARSNEKFQAAISIVGNPQTDGWTIASTNNKDSYAIKLTRTNPTVEPNEVALHAISEFQGRSRIDSFTFPIDWIQPVEVSLTPVEPVVVGTQFQVRATITRNGNDPQPVTLSFAGNHSAFSLPSEPVTVAADQTTAEFRCTLSPDFDPSKKLSFQCLAKTMYQGVPIESSHPVTNWRAIDSPSTLQVIPEKIALEYARASEQILITGMDKAGRSRDWTRDAKMAVADPSIAELRAGKLYPKANGKTDLLITAGTSKMSVPIEVRQVETHRPMTFENDVLVALCKQGCNSGACHGSPSGKGGFRMSLRAFDRKLDELTLIREDFGRRINTVEPEASLLLTKPIMKVPHGGGKQLRTQDDAYSVLRDWIEQGAKPDKEDSPRCTRLEIAPNQHRTLDLHGDQQQMIAMAHFSDGSRRNVTDMAVYESSNTAIATVDRRGLVTPLARGETAILVRFLEHIESVTLMCVEEVPGLQWQATTSSNPVDVFVQDKLRQLQYPPSDLCDDSEFLRRVHLDVIGLLPSKDEIDTFLTDHSSDKRSRLIDRLLAREEYAKFWALKWGDWLKMTSKSVGEEGLYKYHRWIENSLRSNMPYDEFASQLLLSSGSTLSHPPANFYRTAGDDTDCVETISQVFMGARLQCAKCHNHPFERWTQDNYYGLAGFFHRLERRKTQRPGESLIWQRTTGEVIHPRTGKPVQPWLPMQAPTHENNTEDRRIAFVNWLTSADNPYFARVETNRIWSQFFVRGIIDPIDDFRDSNPPCNQQLLDALAEEFVTHGFDRKHLVRTILNSRTYQTSFKTNPWNASDSTYFSHQVPRRLKAEQLLDAINHVLGTTQVFGSLPTSKATHIPAPEVAKLDFLKTFGQPERNTVCDCERSEDSSLGMAIELFNGSFIHEKLRSPENRFRKMMSDGKTVQETIQEIYYLSYCRKPTETELNTATEHCLSRGDTVLGIEDLCWAILNTDEFLFQH